MLAKTHYSTIFLNTLIFVLCCVLASITIIGILILPALSGGFYNSLIEIAKENEVRVGQIFKKGFSNLLSLLFAAIIQGAFFVFLIIICYLIFLYLGGLGIMIGSLLFLPLLIYFIIAWSFTIFVIVDYDARAVVSLSRSRYLIHSVGWWKTVTIFTLSSMLYYVVQLVALLPTIGTILSIVLPLLMSPFIAMIYIVYYVEVSQRNSE